MIAYNGCIMYINEAVQFIQVHNYIINSDNQGKSRVKAIL